MAILFKLYIFIKNINFCKSFGKYTVLFPTVDFSTHFIIQQFHFWLYSPKRSLIHVLKDKNIHVITVHNSKNHKSIHIVYLLCPKLQKYNDLKQTILSHSLRMLLVQGLSKCGNQSEGRSCSYFRA